MKFFRAFVILLSLTLVSTLLPFQEVYAKNDDVKKWASETLQPIIQSSVKNLNDSWEKNWTINLSAYLVEGDKDKTLKKLRKLRTDIQNSQKDIKGITAAKQASRTQKKDLKLIKQSLDKAFSARDKQVEKMISAIEKDKRIKNTTTYEKQINKSDKQLKKANQAYAKLQQDLKLDVEKISFDEIVALNATKAKDILTIEKEKNDKAAKKKAAEEEKLRIENENQEITKLKKQLEDQQTAHKEQTEALQKEIAELKKKNSTLSAEVDSLKKQVASKSASSATSTPGTSSGGASTSAKTKDSTQATSNGSEWFKNCTELRKKYPNGVAQDHPAYQAKMDRDKDGWACER